MMLARWGFGLARPLLAGLDPERAHGLTVAALRLLPAGPPRTSDPRLRVSALGLDFPNPLGLAAGFDKNADVPDQMLGLGFGFTEIGTVTPRPQAGNERPRLFRLAGDAAVINRMGFNNDGHQAALARLAARRARPGIVGVNLGANKDSEDRVGDYVRGIAAFSHVASYFTVNVSSPNTPGLRGLQSKTELAALLDRLNAARARQAMRPPMLLKIAPDLGEDELDDIAGACGGGAVDGIVVSNTTLGREGVSSPLKAQAGGLSGRPLLALSTLQLARMHVRTEGRIPLVGVGGIGDWRSALLKIEAGASLLQLYTALVYRGPALVAEILGGLAHHAPPLAGARGSRAAEIAHHGLSGR